MKPQAACVPKPMHTHGSFQIWLGHKEWHPVPRGRLSTLMSLLMFMGAPSSNTVPPLLALVSACLPLLHGYQFNVLFSANSSLNTWTLSHSLTHPVCVFFTETRAIWNQSIHLHSILIICGTNVSISSGGSAVKNPPANAGNPESIPGWGRSLREGNGNPLQ